MFTTALFKEKEERGIHAPTKMKTDAVNNQESLGQDARDGYLWGVGSGDICNSHRLLSSVLILILTFIKMEPTSRAVPDTRGPVPPAA